MDAGPHAHDPELRRLTLRLLAAVAADPDGGEAAGLLAEYEALVDRRRMELLDDVEALQLLELDHAVVIIDAGESMGLGSWAALRRATEEAGVDPVEIHPQRRP